jgi:exodeoxyribonuclease VII large subunit
LSDLVADLRAPTPSAAAELVSQDNNELQSRLVELSKRAHHLFIQKIKTESLTLQTFNHRLTQVHPERKLQLYQQKSDELNIRLDKAIQRELERFRSTPEKLAQALQHCDPTKQILLNKNQISQLDARLKRGLQRLVKTKTEQFVSVIEQLNIVSPLATIARGYSVSRNSKGQVIRSISQVDEGEKLTIQVSDGRVFTQVINKN